MICIQTDLGVGVGGGVSVGVGVGVSVGVGVGLTSINNQHHGSNVVRRTEAKDKEPSISSAAERATAA